jgi:hypothetical protein
MFADPVQWNMYNASNFTTVRFQQTFESHEVCKVARNAFAKYVYSILEYSFSLSFCATKR